MATGQTERGVPLSKLNPKFLHTNSTSHTWPFSAIAELIDNAYDPDVNAKQIWIDKTQIKHKECLTFMDNGNGLSYDRMHRMLSFGYSNKKAVNGKHPIGMYGNGFKSGSMRLGQDAIVLSKSKTDLCVGMLSQTYLKKTGVEHIAVPIISIKKPEANNVLEEHRASLREILRYSPFNTQEDLLTELQAIESTCSSTGTRIIIWNLRRTSEGNMEFEFSKDDIRIPSDVLKSTTEPDQRPERSDSFVPESDLSLRAYCSVLYMKPRMQINIRGQKVKTQLISESLADRERYTYKPNVTKQEIPITFGYNENNMDQYGIMMYYKNRLIKAYHRVGCQLKANNRLGIGVIGVIECNFLEPTHNKQNFNDTNTYRNAIRNVAGKLGEYCKEIRLKRKKSNPSDNVPVEETEDKMTGELEETPREGTSGMTAPGNRTAKRAKPNVDERELEMHMSLRSSTASTNPDLHEKVKQLEEEKTSISAECENTKSSMKELQTKVQQLEEEKASISAECENAKSSLVKLVEEKASISAAHEETKTSLTELQTRVQQLEEEKASISAECENAKSRAQKQNGCPCERDQVNYQCNIIEEIMEQVLSNNGPTSH